MVSNDISHGFSCIILHTGIQPGFVWWRRGESNPCPKALPQKLLRVQFLFGISAKVRTGTN